MRRFGTDKPDLRYGMELVDLASVFAGHGVQRVRVGALVRRAGPALRAPGGGVLSRKELDQLVADTKGRGAAGLVWIVVEDAGVRSPVEKHLAPSEIAGCSPPRARRPATSSDRRRRAGSRRGRARRAAAHDGGAARTSIPPDGMVRSAGSSSRPCSSGARRRGAGRACTIPSPRPPIRRTSTPPRRPAARLRPRPERRRARRRQHPHPPARCPAARSSRPSASLPRTPRSSSATCWRRSRTGLRPTAASRSAGPPVMLLAGEDEHPRGHRLPEDAVGRRPDDRGPVAGRRPATARAGPASRGDAQDGGGCRWLTR